MRPISRTLFPLLAICFLSLKPVAAQSIDGRGSWEPLGAIPVDEAGAGRRGYVLPAENADVAAPGTNRFSVHFVAANDFYREETGSFLISQRSEAHTVALGYRRGFKLGMLPRVEFGGQLQVTESDSGMLNGFISGFESAFTSLTGAASAKNQLRTAPGAMPPLGMLVVKDGRTLYQSTGAGSGFGDLSFVAKALLRDGDPASHGTRVAARVGLNVSGSSDITEGNFAGVGLSVDRKLTGWAAFHGDVRATFILDRVSQLTLPLSRTSFGFSTGAEVRVSKNSSASLQIDGSSTPYLPTGALAFDKDYGDVTFGFSRRFEAGRRHVIAQVYARENMNLPFSVRWNTDPDLSVGIKATIQ